ncbi:MAG: hypothetical protein EH225_12320 [Calditrichaeota bacterium]|nr:MAG: hypothetical protein EH225_12320 [Calditrichota bacterium]
MKKDKSAKFSTLILLFLIMVIILTGACNRKNIQTPLYEKVEGTWSGVLNNEFLFLTFIEGSFENSPTLTGSGSISSDSSQANYLILGGTITREDSLIFSLETVQPKEKISFSLSGLLIQNRIEGKYIKYDSAGSVLQEGT